MKRSANIVCAICESDGVHRVGCTAHWFDYPIKALGTLSAHDHNLLVKEAVKRGITIRHKFIGLDRYLSSGCAICGQGIETH